MSKVLRVGNFLITSKTDGFLSTIHLCLFALVSAIRDERALLDLVFLDSCFSNSFKCKSYVASSSNAED